jgi:hypothetical protein
VIGLCQSPVLSRIQKGKQLLSVWSGSDAFWSEPAVSRFCFELLHTQTAKRPWSRIEGAFATTGIRR